MNGVGFALFLLFMCSWFLHLTARVPALGALRVDLVLVTILIGLSLSGRHDRARPDIDLSRSLWILLAYSLLTIPLVEWPGSVLWNGFPTFFKAFVFFQLTQAFVNTPGRLKVLMVVFLGCQVFRILEPLYLHLTEGYWGSFASMSGWEYMDRLSGAPYDVVNPNGLAFIVLTTLPLLHYISSSHIVGRVTYVLLLPALVYTLLLTGSRSGLVGLTAIALLIWWKSRHKVFLAAAVAVGIAIAIPQLSPEMRDRYVSIWDSNTKNAVTAEGRTQGVSLDLQVALRRPLFGHGLGTSREANANFGGRDQPSHNLYTEVAQELGFVGLLVFLHFIRTLAGKLRAVVKEVRALHAAEVYEARVASALQVWLAMNLLFSFAAYGLSGHDWYFAAGLTVVLSRLAAADVPATADAPVVVPAPVTRPAGWPALPAPRPLVRT